MLLLLYFNRPIIDARTYKIHKKKVTEARSPVISPQLWIHYYYPLKFQKHVRPFKFHTRFDEDECLNVLYVTVYRYYV